MHISFCKQLLHQQPETRRIAQLAYMNLERRFRQLARNPFLMLPTTLSLALPFGLKVKMCVSGILLYHLLTSCRVRSLDAQHQNQNQSALCGSLLGATEQECGTPVMFWLRISSPRLLECFFRDYLAIILLNRARWAVELKCLTIFADNKSLLISKQV